MVKKSKKIWLIIVLGFVGLILLVTLSINPLLKNLIASRVEERLVGNFYYHYDNLSVDLLTRSITLDHITWRFPKDTTVFNQKGHIDHLTFSGISLLPLIRGNHFRIQGIRFDSLNLVTRIENKTKEDPEEKDNSNNDNFNFYDLIKGQLKSLEVEKIEIIDGQATWLNPETNTIWRQIENVQFEIRHIELDSTKAANNNGWFTLRQATLEGKNGELFLADSLHKIHLKKFHIDYSKKMIIIDSLELVPLLTKSQMPYAKRYETNRIGITAPKIVIKGIDMEALMVSNKLRIGCLLIDQLNLEVFRDKNPPIPDHLHIDLPQIALKNTTLNIKIDSTYLVNSYIWYRELSELTQKEGEVFFSEVNAEFYNITNDSLSYKQNPHAKVSVSSKLMGKASLNVDFTFNLLSDNGDHWIKGNLGQFELTDLNSAFVPLKAISIRSGHIDKLEFDIRLNDYVADGKLTFLYADLKIDKLNKDDLKHVDLNNFIQTLIANTFLVQTSNPSGNGDPRMGVVHYRREKNKSIFNFWLKSILEGIKSTVSNSKEK
jgi:hypothetical protein